LVQGIYKNNSFQVTCSINLFSYIHLGLDGNNDKELNNFSLPPKSRRTLIKTLNYFGFNEKDINLKIKISSEIPQEKGMGSSSADIVGIILGVAFLLNKKISADEVAKLALSIEPTDGIMYEGIVLFDHLKKGLLERIGQPPLLDVLVIDPGGSVDTLKFDQRENLVKLRLEKQKDISKALELVKRGIKENNIGLIGKGATLSALCNQNIIFKKELEKIISISQKMGAVGVNIAHSGVALGVLLPTNYSEIENLKKRNCKDLSR
jgi:L-threonine kinase